MRYIRRSAAYIRVYTQLTKSLSYTDTNVTAGTYYYYKIRAYHKPYQDAREDNTNTAVTHYKYAKPAWPTLSLKAASTTYNSVKLTGTR